MNQADWLKRLKELHAVSNSHQFDLGDHVNRGIETFGRTEAFDAAAEITGTKHTRNFFTRCASVASFYPASLRFPKLSFHTYEVLARFPLDFLSTFIPSVADSGRSCAQIYALAVERYGSDPRRGKKLGKKHVVRLPEKLFCELSARASNPSKTSLLIVQILEDYLDASQSSGKASVPDSPSDVPAPADIQPHPENGVADEKRPTYEERRAAQKAAKLEAQKAAKAANEQKRIAKRTKELSSKKSFFKVRLLWTECHGKSYIDSKDGELLSAGKALRATRFVSEAEAAAVNEQFARYYGYREAVVHCDTCKAWHLKHIYASQVAAAEIDLTKEQKEVRATVNDFIQQRATV
jgi:hypothetical protein